MFSATMTGLPRLVCAVGVAALRRTRRRRRPGLHILAMLECENRQTYHDHPRRWTSAPASSVSATPPLAKPCLGYQSKLTGGIFAVSSSVSLPRCSVMRGGGSCGRLATSCGDISGLAGSGTCWGSTSVGTARSTDAEIWSMFFFWMRSSKERRLFKRGRRPSMHTVQVEVELLHFDARRNTRRGSELPPCRHWHLSPRRGEGKHFVDDPQLYSTS
jgi:hypothetical protein